MKTLVIDRTWDNRELAASEHVTVRLSVEVQRVNIFVDAPFHDDPAPRHLDERTPRNDPAQHHIRICENGICENGISRFEAWMQAPGGPMKYRLSEAGHASPEGALDGWVSGRSVPRLWEHEVVELFFLGADDKYLEVELGPHGHYLVLRLEGRRNIVQQGIVIDYRARIDAQRWRGEVSFPTSLLPKGFDRLNATAIWGQGAKRSYAMWRPCLGSEPDFHALSVFAPFEVK